MKNYLILVMLLLISYAGIAQKDKKPNVLIILSDDQGWGDVGFNGGTDIPTRNLDNLAKEGVVFSQGYATHPYCSPSRAGLLSGRYQQEFGHENNPENEVQDDSSNIGLPLNELLISELLQKNEYQTCAIGKWHLGNAEKFWPINRGFDDWYGFSGGGFNYWGYLGNKSKMLGVLRNGVPVPVSEQTYLTNDFSNEAVKYIDKYAKNKKPFFMYLAYNAPHEPIQATKEYTDKVKYIEDGKRAAYAAMVVGMDAGIGKVIQKLKDVGEYENTLIFFYSDNGPHLSGASAGPYRGHKGMLFEGGIREPFLVSWPNKIKGGRTYDDPIIALDIYPTILSATGIKIPKNKQLDGVDLLPYIEKKNKNMVERTLYWRYSGGQGYAVRSGKYKLVRSEYKEKILLFDIEKDPYEHHDISNEFSDKVAELDEKYKTWTLETVQPLWPDAHIEHVHLEEKNRESFIQRALKN
ncbi:N-acetylgalactosamine-6-sulfatase [Aureibaculum algae]|uniref:N-acetylgalactosamine-6-sulfatase n=1 Tax=Aureibaculum algae TaxID=2584122 RepID=A0A5B7TYE7_9FLAO|nr:sulfatase-like hydrolase/transferase [Aureibaculum algae]QCX40321.1 N-acetylgalactosamine-6-sulfatase [Aureibaculum algae]